MFLLSFFSLINTPDGCYNACVLNEGIVLNHFEVVMLLQRMWANAYALYQI